MGAEEGFVSKTVGWGDPNVPPRPGEKSSGLDAAPNVTGRRDCEHFDKWHFPAGTSLGIPVCTLCGRIDGYELQRVLDEYVARQIAIMEMVKRPLVLRCGRCALPLQDGLGQRCSCL